MFEPTQRCNLRCKMCFQDRAIMAKSKELSLEQIIRFFDQTPYLKKVTLIGGEIFIRHDMLDLIRYLDKDRNIVISTNGTLIGDAEIEALRKFHRVITVCVSLDGPKEIHEAIRQVPGAYNKAVRTIKDLVPFLPVTVTCIIVDDNLKVLPDVVEQCAAMGVKKLKFELERIYLDDGIAQAIQQTGLKSEDLPISSRGRGRGYSIETLQGTLNECLRRGKNADIYITFEPLFLMDEIEACYAGNLRATRRFICQSFRTATIAPNGDLINCYAIRKPFGNILDAPLEEIWNCETAKTYRRQLVTNNLTPLCENCPFCIPQVG
ncbi:MAG: radical SAM protein [Planctomycetota bacterium]